MRKETPIYIWAIGLVMLLFTLAIPWPWYGLDVYVEGETASEVLASKASTTGLWDPSYSPALAGLSKGAMEGILDGTTWFLLFGSFIVGAIAFIQLAAWWLGRAKGAPDIALAVSVLFFFAGIALFSILQSGMRAEDARIAAAEGAEGYEPPFHPNVFSSFSGTYTDYDGRDPVRYSWGPGYGFYFGLASFFVMLGGMLAAVFFEKLRKRLDKVIEIEEAGTER